MPEGPFLCGRRSVLRTLALAGSIPAALRSGNTTPQAPLYYPRFWEESSRPEFVWQNYEDLMYHDLEQPEKEIQTSPEFYSVMGQIWVFNRAMRWYRDGLHDCILCYSAGPELKLTGEKQVSKWHSDPRNRIENNTNQTIFTKNSGRKRDCAVLPAFQFHTGQHPEIELKVLDATAGWQFCASIKGRSGPPIVSTGWRTGPDSCRLNIADALARRGYNLQFAELHFVIGVWTDDANTPAVLHFELQMPAKASLVSSLPVVRSAETAASTGVPITAVMLNESGERLTSRRVRLKVEVAGTQISFDEREGFWIGFAKGLRPGDYLLSISAEGAFQGHRESLLRVTDGNYFRYDSGRRLVERRSKLIGPLTGSYQGTFFFEGVGTTRERMINGQRQWDAWDRKTAPSERQHYWEALTPGELEERFSYLAHCGWDLLHLHQHWGVWERLDAGGRISPHGAEQLALYVRTAGRHGLAHLQSLSSYPYAVHLISNGDGGTPPWSRYLEEAGFKDPDWYDPNRNPEFEKLFNRYLADFALLFREETALFGMTTSGEGDRKNGPARTNGAFHFVRTLDKSHIYSAEPVFLFDKLPQHASRGFDEQLFGGRTYGIGERFWPELDLGVWFKFLQMGNFYMAEGSWAMSNSYTAMHYNAMKNDHRTAGPTDWTGSLEYRLRLRDTYYLGLVHRIPILDTWDEAIAEDEHKVLRQVRSLIDWTQDFIEPEVALCVDDAGAQEKKKRSIVIEYEKFFSGMPLMYRVIPTGNISTAGLTLIDARLSFTRPAFASRGGTLPDAIKRRMPLQIAPGYSASYAWSTDRNTLLAYVYNTTGHSERIAWISGRWHRSPRPAFLSVGLRNFPVGNLHYHLFDLVSKEQCSGGRLSDGSANIDLGTTKHDYFLLVNAEP